MKRIMTVCLILVILAAAAAGGWMWYDNNVDRSGWTEENGITGYRDFHGDPVTGWQDISGSIYYFGQDGHMVRGWQEIDEMRFRFSDSGVLQTGWQTIDGAEYYFSEDGAMLTLWQTIDGKTHYFSDSGILQTGWQDIDGCRYFLDENGSPVTGAQLLDGQSYFFAEDGVMATGWVDAIFYLEDGTRAAGWQEINGQQYFFNEDGTLYTGWMDEGEYRYYFLEDGSMAVGPQQIDGKTYHFSPHGVHIWLVNPWNELHEDYEVELMKSEGGFRVAAVCYDAFTQMIADCRAAGNILELASGYRTYWDQQALFSQKVAEYGAGTASQIVARPNTSEHQLGLAVDIVVPGSTVLNRAQGNSALQQWLMEHCWDYGFILRYPDGTTDITGIIYEPWHYRYVGLEIAQELKELGITLEEYLGAADHK